MKNKLFRTIICVSYTVLSASVIADNHSSNIHLVNLGSSSVIEVLSSPNPVPTQCPYAVQQELTPPGGLCMTSITTPMLVGNDFGTRVANGCSASQGPNWQVSGKIFIQSVMGMEFPRSIDPGTGKPAYWGLSCTATVIAKKWLLTAAHCVASADPNTGAFYGEEATIPLYVVPWQQNVTSSGVGKYDGIPLRVTENDLYTKFKVKAIYIDKHYNYYGQPWPSKVDYPYPDYLKADFALLELEEPLPDNYQIIDLASELPPASSPVWLAGYGTNQDQTINGILNYRNMYYMTNIYPGDEGKKENYGDVYTLGTLPEPYTDKEGLTLNAAWKFSGSGDSGGALFYFNPQKSKYTIIGTLTGGIYCNWAGFFAVLPFPYMQNASIVYYKALIDSVILNPVKTTHTTRCISATNSCYTD